MSKLRSPGASCGLRMSQVCPSLRPRLLYATVAASEQPSQMARAGPLAVINHDPVWSLCPLTDARVRETGGSTHLGGEIVLL